MPEFSTEHIDRGLTNISLMYMNPAYSADMIFPKLPVDKRSNKYFVYSRSAALHGSGLDANGKAKSLRRPKTEAAESDYTLSTQPYYAEEYAQRFLVADAEVNYADEPLQPEIDATVHVTEQLYIDREKMVNYLVGTSGNYPTANKKTLITTTTSWLAYSSSASVPMQDIQNSKKPIIQGIVAPPTHFAVNYQVGFVLSEHPTYRDEFKYVSKEGLTASGLLPNIKGLTVVELMAQDEDGDIWQDTTSSHPYALTYYRNQSVGPRSKHFGRIFNAPDDRSGARDVTIFKYRWEPKKGFYVEGSMTEDYRFVSLDSSSKAIGGYLFLDPIV